MILECITNIVKFFNVLHFSKKWKKEFIAYGLRSKEEEMRMARRELKGPLFENSQLAPNFSRLKLWTTDHFPPSPMYMLLRPIILNHFSLIGEEGLPTAIDIDIGAEGTGEL